MMMKTSGVYIIGDAKPENKQIYKKNSKIQTR